jgi:hypothetical protein
MKFYDIPESWENNFSEGEIGEICTVHERYNLVIATVKSEHIVPYKLPHSYPGYDCMSF